MALALLVGFLSGACGGGSGSLPPDVTSPPGDPVTAVPATTPAKDAANKVPTKGPGTHLGPWTLESRFLVLAALSDQGLATVPGKQSKAIIVFRGSLSVPKDLRAEGWVHVGDPGKWRSDVLDAYQAVVPATSKLFTITSPFGERRDFVHKLAKGESGNNSFVAVAPGGQWMVSGEWGVMHRLLVFPTPVINDVAPPGTPDLPLVATISLNHAVRNVQGCTFDGPKTLLCSTDDPGTDLWPTPYQLLQISLSGPVKGLALRGDVRSLGTLPRLSECRGVFEVEGIDLQTDKQILRVEVRPPGRCGFATTVYQYKRRSGG